MTFFLWHDLPNVFRILLTASSRTTRLLSLLVVLLSVAPLGMLHVMWSSLILAVWGTGNDIDNSSSSAGQEQDNFFWILYLGLPGGWSPPPPEEKGLSSLLNSFSRQYLSSVASRPPAAQSSSSLTVEAANATLDELWSAVFAQGAWANRHPLWIQYHVPQVLGPQHWKVVIPWFLFFFAAVVLPCNLLLLQVARVQWVRFWRKRRRQRNYNKAAALLKSLFSYQLKPSDFFVVESKEPGNSASPSSPLEAEPLAQLWRAFFPQAPPLQSRRCSGRSRILVAQCRLPASPLRVRPSQSGDSLASQYDDSSAASSASSRWVMLDDPCSICLHSYECRDEIVWSPNPRCPHVFHQRCLLRWLHHNPRFPCPVCRRPYVVAAPPTSDAKPPRTMADNHQVAAATG